MITKFVMENVLPFRGRVELNLANRGVVLIRGDVRVSAAADSNGAGKTSLVHGLCLGHFGVDMNGRRADAVACRFTTGPGFVEVHHEDALGAWGVRWQFRPSKLETWGIGGVLENEDIAVLQKKVEDRLGFGLRTFKNAVVFGQGSFERFASADQAEAMRMLDEIQGLDLRAALKDAKDWRDGLKFKLDEAARDVEHAEGNVAAWQSDIERYEMARDEFEGQRVVKVDRLRGELDEIGRKRSASEKDLQLVGMKRQIVDSLRAEIDAEQAAALPVAKLHERAQRLDLAFETATRKREDLNERLAELLDQGACPTCRQAVQSRRAAIRKLFTRELKELKDAADDAYDAFKPVSDEYNREQAKLEALRKRIRKMVPEAWAENISRYLREQESECSLGVEKTKRVLLASITERVKQVKAELGSEQDAVWSGDADLRNAREQLSATQAAVLAAGELQAKLTSAVAMADYCVEALGDRGVRSMVADGVADFMNDRVAAHLEFLACGEATMTMSTQTELKRGGSRERISWRPEWAWGGEGDRSGSGGQDHRVNLAVFAATQDLAESHGARPFPVKVYDEVFDGLDSRGQELAVQWIRAQAREHGTVLLITHSKELEALVDADAVWTVVLDNDGARVEES